MTTNFIEILQLALQAAGVLLVVDFASGILHWLEDSYGKATWPVLGKRVIQPNIKHHFFPRAFTKTSFLSRNSVTILLAALMLGVVGLFGALNWMWVMAALVGAISNEIHCWAHRSPRENGKVISFLQKLGILQSAKAHGKHHTDPKDCSYCTVTNFLNPVIDRMELWARAEGVIEKVFGVTRRVDDSVKKDRKGKKIAGEGCRCLTGGACANCFRKKENKDKLKLVS